VLTVAGSDPSGGAGLQADLAVFAALRCHGMAVVGGLTAQNTRGVTADHPLPAEFVTRQIEALFDDCPPAAAKTGMLASEQIVGAVVSAFSARPDVPLVVDPVAVAGGGARLIDAAAERAIATSLAPIAAVVTPNAAEASSMTGVDVTDADAAAAAARRLVEMGARAALVKGGHVDGDRVVDVLVETGRPAVFIARPRIASTRRVHGTGCALSAAIAAHLARGASLERAVRLAGDYVHAAIAAAHVDGAGAAILDFAAGSAGSPR
jgi:hydroxymethylpyrimidine/phosphomethylpyrimidine kinase